MPTDFRDPAYTVDPQLRQQYDALSKKFDEAFNNNDAASLSALFAKDAVALRIGTVINSKNFLRVFRPVAREHTPLHRG